MYRDTLCGEPRKADVGKTVTVAGWVQRRRDHGSLIFVDLRDRAGIVQVVFNADVSAEAHSTAQDLRAEWVVKAVGTIVARREGAENPDLATGEVEISASELEVLNPAKTPPFEVRDDIAIDENTRLQYRYIDLRRPRMQRNLALRHRVAKLMRDYLDERGFLEIETPILIKSTPEGARDYLVPSRVYPGRFYALPQSPQQLKQLLMMSGMDRYFQIAHCFRDEDTRADRQVEHTQLDLEMSFVEQEDVLTLMEGLYAYVTEAALPGARVITPFPRLTYAEAIERYATDKPDLRFGLEMAGLTDIAADSGFGVFRSVADAGGQVRGFVAPGCCDYTRRQLDELIELAKSSGAAGMITVAISPGASSIDEITKDDVRSVIKSHVSLDTIKRLAKRTGGAPGDLVMIVAGPESVVNAALTNLRNEMARRLGLIDSNTVSFLFVVDFPLFEWNAEEDRWDATHHVFSSPRSQDLDRLESDPGSVKGQLYDLVCNGVELGSGSIRIHDRALQERMFKLLGYTAEEVEERFGHLLKAFEYGAPPHGGAGLGLDRFVMVLAGEDSIREVMAFPKTQTAVDPLFGAPASVTDEQLAELHLRLVGPERAGGVRP